MEDQDWKGKVPNDTHNDYIASIVEWLGANIQTLEIHNADIVYSCSFVCIQHLWSKVMDILATSKAISKINMNGIHNLSLDVEYIEQYIVSTLKDQYPRTYSALNELRQFIKLMNGDLLRILDDNIYRAEFSSLKTLKLQQILKKFKDKSKDSEVKKLLKKLNEKS